MRLLDAAWWESGTWTASLEGAPCEEATTEKGRFLHAFFWWEGIAGGGKGDKLARF